MSDARRFIDRYGFAWQVCELWSTVPRSAVNTAADAAPSADGWLYFFSRGTTLVLRDYPASWLDLGWAELERLRERAEVLGSDTTIRVPQAQPVSYPRPSRVGARDQAMAASADDASRASTSR